MKKALLIGSVLLAPAALAQELPSPELASSWIELFSGPVGGMMAASFMLGAGIGIFLWQKYVVVPKIKAHEDSCEARLAALRSEVDEIKPIAQKWQRFMEKKAFESLGMPGGMG